MAAERRAAAGATGAAGPAAEMRNGLLRIGDRVLWQDLTFALGTRELLAVIGPNGSGKTSLLRVLLGLRALSSGEAAVLGRPPRRGDAAVGYVPQQHGFDPDLPLRGRELVGFGIDGHRWGWALRTDPERRRRVDEALAAVGAAAYADAAVGRLSGGEQQRLRIAQALAGRPRLLLCDEPLAGVDFRRQGEIVALLSAVRRQRDLPTILVTHDVNPLLTHLDRVLCVAGGRFVIGAPEDVLTTEAMSRLYGWPVEVLWHGGRLVMLGADVGGHGSPRAERGAVR